MKFLSPEILLFLLAVPVLVATENKSNLSIFLGLFSMFEIATIST